MQSSVFLATKNLQKNSYGEFKRSRNSTRKLWWGWKERGRRRNNKFQNKTKNMKNGRRINTTHLWEKRKVVPRGSETNLVLIQNLKKHVLVIYLNSNGKRRNNKESFSNFKHNFVMKLFGLRSWRNGGSILGRFTTTTCTRDSCSCIGLKKGMYESAKLNFKKPTNWITSFWTLLHLNWT